MNPHRQAPKLKLMWQRSRFAPGRGRRYESYGYGRQVNLRELLSVTRLPVTGSLDGVTWRPMILTPFVRPVRVRRRGTTISAKTVQISPVVSAGEKTTLRRHHPLPLPGTESQSLFTTQGPPRRGPPLAHTGRATPPRPVRAVCSAAWFAASTLPLPLPFSATVATSVGLQAKRVSVMLKHAATRKVQTLSPVEAPKSQLGSLCVHSRFLPGNPLGASAGTGSVSHSISQSAAAFPPPGTNWSMQLGSRTPLPHPAVGDALAEGVKVGLSVGV
jgi:hypothetical protein